MAGYYIPTQHLSASATLAATFDHNGSHQRCHTVGDIPISCCSVCALLFMIMLSLVRKCCDDKQSDYPALGSCRLIVSVYVIVQRKLLSHFSVGVDSFLPVAYAIARCNGQPVVLCVFCPELNDLAQMGTFSYAQLPPPVHPRTASVPAARTAVACKRFYRQSLESWTLNSSPKFGNALKPTRGDTAHGFPYFGISRSALKTGRLPQL